MLRNDIHEDSPPQDAFSKGPLALGVVHAGREIAAGRLSPVDLVEAALARIERVDGGLNSFIRVMADEARASAKAAASDIARNGPRGPLHGIPFAVKDNYDLAGTPTTGASRSRLGALARRDAPVVAALREAGAVLIGKLATWEYGTGDGGEYFDLPFPPARNPWDPARFTGGSSTGAGVAVAAGLVSFAMGSDTTGSVRLPAAACGAAGMISTPSRLSLDGLLPNCHSLDVPGPICRSVEDLAIVLDALYGAGALQAQAARPAEGMRVAVIGDPGPGLPEPDPAMRAGFEAGLARLRDLGVELVEARLATPAAECLALTQMIGPAESAAIHEAELRERPDELGRALRGKLLTGSMVRAVDYIQAQRRRTEVAAEVDSLLAGVDALVTYGALHVAPRLGVEPEMTAFTRETMLTPFNLSGHPALVQRTGLSDEGLPTHWQIVARRGDEGAALRLAAAFERAGDAPMPWPELPAQAPEPPRPAMIDDGAPTDAFRARAARMGLGHLPEADLGRMETLEARTLEVGAAFPRPRSKATPPAFGMQRPPDPGGG